MHVYFLPYFDCFATGGVNKSVDELEDELEDELPAFTCVLEVRVVLKKFFFEVFNNSKRNFRPSNGSVPKR